MNHTKNHNHGGCCGGDKPHDHDKPEKEKDGCCDNDEAKKPDADKTEKQGGCCGSKE